MHNFFKKGLFLFLVLPILAIGQKTQGITHSFFVAGPQFTGIVDETGEELWNSKRPGARDGYVLENGNLFSLIKEPRKPWNWGPLSG